MSLPKPCVLVTTSSIGGAARDRLESLRGRGWDVVINPLGRRLDEAEAIDLYGRHDPIGVIAGVEPVTRQVLAVTPSLRVISRVGTGVDSIDLAALAERDIALRTTPDAPAGSVAELTLGLMLALLRRIAVSDRDLRKGKWTRPGGTSLAGLTVLVIGGGRVGSRLAQLLAAFDAKVVVYDPLVAPGDLWSLVPGSDIVTFHVPLTAETRGMANAAFFGRMKPGAVLINAARGGIVDERALAAALSSGHLAGAALDVFENEPYEGALLSFDQVVLTPHIGSSDLTTRSKMETEAIQNLLAVLDRAAP